MGLYLPSLVCVSPPELVLVSSLLCKLHMLLKEISRHRKWKEVDDYICVEGFENVLRRQGMILSGVFVRLQILEVRMPDIHCWSLEIESRFMPKMWREKVERWWKSLKSAKCAPPQVHKESRLTLLNMEWALPGPFYSLKSKRADGGFFRCWQKSRSTKTRQDEQMMLSCMKVYHVCDMSRLGVPVHIKWVCSMNW